jgi:CspA family cold shock protein
MPNGVIKWFDNRKGFGFIASERGEDIFVHYKNISGEGFRSLNDGDTVSYELVQGPKGLLARDVRVVQSAAPQRSLEHGAEA